MAPNEAGLTGEAKVLLDRVAALTVAANEALSEVRAIYDGYDRARTRRGLQYPPQRP
jgi:hypothetical protein